MQSLASVAHKFDQPLFDVQVNIFQIQQPLKAASGDLAADLRHSALDIGQVLGRDHTHRSEHFGVSERATNIEQGQAFIEVNRRGIAFDEIGHGLGEAC